MDIRQHRQYKTHKATANSWFTAPASRHPALLPSHWRHRRGVSYSQAAAQLEGGLDGSAAHTTEWDVSCGSSTPPLQCTTGAVTAAPQGLEAYSTVP